MSWVPAHLILEGTVYQHTASWWSDFLTKPWSRKSQQLEHPSRPLNRLVNIIANRYSTCFVLFRLTFCHLHIYSQFEHLLCFIRSDLRTSQATSQHSNSSKKKWWETPRKGTTGLGGVQPTHSKLLRQLINGHTSEPSSESTCLQNPFHLILAPGREGTLFTTHNVYSDNFRVQTQMKSGTLNRFA